MGWAPGRRRQRRHWGSGTWRVAPGAGAAASRCEAAAAQEPADAEPKPAGADEAGPSGEAGGAAQAAAGAAHPPPSRRGKRPSSSHAHRAGFGNSVPRFSYNRDAVTGRSRDGGGTSMPPVPQATAPGGGSARERRAQEAAGGGSSPRDALAEEPVYKLSLPCDHCVVHVMALTGFYDCATCQEALTDLIRGDLAPLALKAKREAPEPPRVTTAIEYTVRRVAELADGAYVFEPTAAEVAEAEAEERAAQGAAAPSAPHPNEAQQAHQQQRGKPAAFTGLSGAVESAREKMESLEIGIEAQLEDFERMAERRTEIKKNAAYCLKAIREVYLTKLEADDFETREGGRKSPLHKFVVEMYVHKLGTRKLAEMALVDLFTSCHEHRDEAPGILLFLRFCGSFRALSNDELDFYLTAFRLVAHQSPPSVFRVNDDGTAVVLLRPGRNASITVSTARALETVVFALRDAQHDEFGIPGLAEKLAKAAQSLGEDEDLNAVFRVKQLAYNTQRRSARGRNVTTIEMATHIDLDAFMDILLEENAQGNRRLAAYLQELMLAGDLNADGRLTFAEFSQLMKATFPQFSERQVMGMFREGLGEGQEDLDRILIGYNSAGAALRSAASGASGWGAASGGRASAASAGWGLASAPSSGWGRSTQ
eukprot:tig00000254_g22530.t1